MKWLHGVIVIWLAASGCDSDIVVVHLENIPAGTAAVRLSTSLSTFGQDAPTPQEDIVVTSDLSAPIGLRFPIENVLELDISAAALRSDGSVCGSTETIMLQSLDPPRQDLILSFSGIDC
jgi:hypothetical protein